MPDPNPPLQQTQIKLQIVSEKADDVKDENNQGHTSVPKKKTIPSSGTI